MASSSFRRDLKAFLSLSSEQLLTLAAIGDGDLGFSPTQALDVATSLDLKADQAGRILAIAEYLYESARTKHVAPSQALEELTALGEKLGVDIVETEGFAAVLKSKDKYETERYGRALSVSLLPHFTSLGGIWDLRPVFNRTSKNLVGMRRVLLLSLSAHDSTGEQSLVCQLDEEDWSEFLNEVEEIKNALAQVEALDV